MFVDFCEKPSQFWLPKDLTKDTPEKAQELGKLIYLNCPGGWMDRWAQK